MRKLAALMQMLRVRACVRACVRVRVCSEQLTVEWQTTRLESFWRRPCLDWGAAPVALNQTDRSRSRVKTADIACREVADR